MNDVFKQCSNGVLSINSIVLPQFLFQFTFALRNELDGSKAANANNSNGPTRLYIQADHKIANQVTMR